jgi:hypothetical protein
MTCSDDRSVKLWNPHKSDAVSGSALCIKTYNGVHGYQIFDIAISQVIYIYRYSIKQAYDFARIKPSLQRVVEIVQRFSGM